MAPPIRIGALDAAEASDLAQSLAARGLVGRRVSAGGSSWVEVHETREETRRLLADLVEAVETWLAEHERLPALEIHVEDTVTRVPSRGDLRDALRERVRARARGNGGA